MSLLLHAIVPAEGASAADGTVAIEAGPVAAIASPHECFRALEQADMLAHHERIADLHARHDACLPARFPTLLADADSLRGLLKQRVPELMAALDRVRGRSELAVTARWERSTETETERVVADTPGRRYLLERQQAFHSADRQREVAAHVAHAIETTIADQLVEAQRKLCPRPDTALSLSLLVPTPQAVELRERIMSNGAPPDVRILVLGPWPPYSFVALAMKGE
jgi:Gas vesicle synthesis protein GvpL/GvpF